MSLSTRHAKPIVVGALILGAAVRLAFLDYATPDVPVFLLPWYEFAREHGVGALRHAFTNYAPFMSYLLLGIVQLDGLAAPLALIKFISYPFELGSAVLAALLVRTLDPRPERAALAFAGLWLSSSVLHNGAFWGQCDSIWTFFLLAALLAFCRDRPGLGAVAFAVACSVKIQAVFLAPLVLALVLRRALHVAWLASIPAVYLVLAVPVLAAGRPFGEVLRVYLDQAGTYHALSMGAPNLYLFIPDALYGPGVALGLAVSAVAGLAFAVRVARAPRLPPEHLLLAACVSLAMVPFLLPKMHDRYFYAFEALVIVLACLRPVLIPVALMAQISSRFCYLPFDGRGSFAQPPAGLASLVLLLYLATLLERALAGRFGPTGAIAGDRAEVVRPLAALWGGLAVYLVLLQAASPWVDGSRLWPTIATEPVGLAAFGIVLIGAVMVLSWSDRPGADRRSHRPSAVPAG